MMCCNRDLGKKQGASPSLINLNFHKHIEHSNYNSKLGILGMVFLGVMCLVGVMGILFFNPAMLSKMGRHKPQ